VKGWLKKFYYTPFLFCDELDLSFKGHQLNLFRKFRRLRKTAFFVAVLFLGLWVVMGFDSTVGQLIHPVHALPELLSGELSMCEWVMIYHDQYGKEMHLSAFVIYGLAFWWLSRHFDKNLGIYRSKNVCYASAVTLISIALFEFYWMISYSSFQHQPWVFTFRMPQLKIILQNVAFLCVGVLALLYMWIDGHLFDDEGDVSGRVWGFRWTWISFVLIGLSVFSAVLWIRYPFHVEPLSVELSTGEMWGNTRFFPQTLYTIDLDPMDDVNAGVWFWVENDLIHLVNTVTKVLWTLTFVYVCALKTLKRNFYPK
jgi:hypothetical protein